MSFQYKRGASLAIASMGKVIRAFRVARNETQEQFGVALGVTGEYVSMIENGHRYTSMAYLEKLAKGLGVRMSTLFFLAEECAKGDGAALIDLNKIREAVRRMEGVGTWGPK